MAKLKSGPSHQAPEDNVTEGEATESEPKTTTSLSQRDKFTQAAREAGCDETGEKLDEALRTIGRAKRR